MHIMVTNSNTERPFTNRNGIAARYGVARRTINEWMRMGLLVYFKIRNVVRFDVAACDKSLLDNGML